MSVPLADGADEPGRDEPPPTSEPSLEGETPRATPETRPEAAAEPGVSSETLPPGAPGMPHASRQPSAEVRALASWVRVVAGAIVFALALRVLAFEAYRIPSTSMEDTLQVGDFVLVSKLHYGPRVLGRRVPGFSRIHRGDVAVFNYPPDLDPDPARRTPYIKRIVGLPGDTLAVVGKEVVIGTRALAPPRRSRQLWLADGRLPSAETLDSLGLGGRVQRVAAGRWAVSATRPQAGALAATPGVTSVEPLLRPLGDGSADFPAAFHFSLDDYGPVVIPQRGQTVALDDLSWPVIRSVVERYEGHTAERTAEGFLIDGRPADTYTFAQDYYFALGDSRDDSADSRTWGFVPFDHVIGKAIGVYFSWDDEARAVRWDRVGEGVGE